MTVKRALTTRHLPLLTLSTAVIMQVVDAAPGNAAHHQTFLAPVKLERFARLERQSHEGMRRFARSAAPRADEGGELAVPARLDLHKQRLGAAWATSSRIRNWDYTSGEKILYVAVT